MSHCFDATERETTERAVQQGETTSNQMQIGRIVAWWTVQVEFRGVW
jgi:hypothetical protein